MMLNLKPDVKYVLALSGGVDSMVLLDILSVGNFKFRAIHVNHNASELDDEWATFVSNVCHNKNVNLSSFTVYPVRDGKGFEAAARKERYGIFAAHVSPDEILLTGHHRDDSVETILFNLFRGSGLGGVTGLKEFATHTGVTIQRPMLNICKNAIYEYAKNKNIAYLEDATNDDMQFTRNHIRRKVIPIIQEKFSTVVNNIMSFAEKANVANELMFDLYMIDKQKFNRQNFYRPEGFFSANELLTLSDNRMRNIIYWYTKTEYNVVLTEDKINEIIKLIKRKVSKTKCSIKVATLIVTKDIEIIHISPE